jgi:plasmid stabilization system protein ParE
MSAARPGRLHAMARKEIEAADEWYLARNLNASREFLADLDAAVEEILRAPHRWAKYLYGTRRFVLQRFPFSVVYLDDPDLVIIVAVAHSRRKPGYWKDRI